MDARDRLRWYARVRTGLGAATIALPRAVAPLWIGREAAREHGALLVTRALGGRDLVLGVGIENALNRGASARGWLLGGMLADGVDVLAGVTGGRDLPVSVRAGVAISAGAWLAVGAKLYRADGSPPGDARATYPPPS